MDDNLKERTNDFVHALAASGADVANISTERTGNGMRVTYDVLNLGHVRHLGNSIHALTIEGKQYLNGNTRF